MEPTHKTTAIAVIGMSCRFPQADSPEAFWKILKNGIQTVSELSDERWQIDHHYDPDKSAEGKTNQRHGSLLPNPDDFDPLFFNISPSEAMEMSPSQKLMLELAWEAMEFSNMPVSHWLDSETGVYIGNIWNDFEHLRKQKNAPVRQHSAMGQSTNLIANRVSYAFGFTGPSLVTDTGCSSSLVALHLALQGLWEGSIRQAMVGGINHTLDIDQSVLLSKFGGLSSKGRCSTFDAGGDGFVRGEGAGMIALKKLEDAEKDGDHILAVIRGSAMNNNGFNESLPATSVKGQMAVLKRAYQKSGINPSEVHYVEAHGTGTKLGDPTECRALGTFFGQSREGNALRVGSVKTNVGHTEAAAGMAGLIKVILSMQHREIPASLNYHTPNPDIDFNGLKLQVQNKLSVWPAAPGETLKAGVNSFGWGGTNAHVVVEEYKPVASGQAVQSQDYGMLTLPLYGRSATALKEYAGKYIHHLNTHINGCREPFIDLCRDTALRKLPMPYRLVVSGRDKESLVAQLKERVEGLDKAEPALNGTGKSVFIFPGQGSQWAGMGAALYQTEPVFKSVIDECEKAYTPYVDWSLTGVLFAGVEEDKLSRIDIIQPALCAVMIALGKLWQSKGIVPDAVVGHSMGEVAAACVAGVLSLDEAALIICTRSRLMRTVAGKGGAMAVAELTVTEADEICSRYDGRLSVAVNNSRKSTVLAGNEDDIKAVLIELEDRGLFCRQVKVDVASHSPQMDKLTIPLKESLNALRPLKAEIAIYSTVEARQMEGTDMDDSYWVRNLRHTVKYASVIETLLSEGYTTFIEVSPHPVLSTPTQEVAAAAGTEIVSCHSLSRGKDEAGEFYGQVAELTEKGHDPDWFAFYDTLAPAGVRLPSYPFQRETYALEDRSAEVAGTRNSGSHPFLDKPLQLPGMDTTWFFEAHIGTGQFPYLKDHSIRNEAVLPGAAYLDMVWSAAEELLDTSQMAIHSISYEQALYLPEGSTAHLFLKMEDNGDDAYKFTFYRKTEQTDKAYQLLCQGVLGTESRAMAYPAHPPVSEAADLEHTAGFYKGLTRVGLDYGPHFRGLESIGYYGLHELRATLAISETVENSLSRYTLHPALLDSCFQTIFGHLKTEGRVREESYAYLTGIGSITCHRRVDKGQELRLITNYRETVNNQNNREVFTADITLYADGLPVFTASDVSGTVVSVPVLSDTKDTACEKVWVNEMAPWESRGITGQKWLILGDDTALTDQLIDAFSDMGAHPVGAIAGESLSINDSATMWTFKPGYEADYHNLLNAGNWAGVVHAADYGAREQADESGIAVLPGMSLIYTSRALVEINQKPPLFIISQGLLPLGRTGKPVNLQEATRNGIARVIMNEFPEVRTSTIDLSLRPGPAEIGNCIHLLSAGIEEEREYALRGEYVYVPRLQPVQSSGAAMAVQYAPDGTYLVSGFRGLGFSFVEHMISHGVRYLLLLSRTGHASDSVMQKIRDYRSQGIRIELVRADVSDLDTLEEIIDKALIGLPAIKGIVHAAGIISPNSLNELDKGEYGRILAPKAGGAWNLHLLSKKYPVEDFIMFSSASVLIGLTGQASYVAANAYQDSLADYRRQEGLPGLSIQWGVIKDVGMVADKQHLQRFAEAEGFVFMKSAEAMQQFSALYRSDLSNVAVCRIDAEKMAGYYPRLASAPYFHAMLPVSKSGNGQEMSLAVRLSACEDAADGRVLVLSHIKEVVAEIIRTTPDKVEKGMTFSALGVDSLMTIQLRNKLENSLTLKISVAAFKQHPTLGGLAGFLYKEFKAASEEVDTAASVQHQWLHGDLTRLSAPARVICFHDAGGDATLYEEWADLMKGEVDVIAVELPGRNSAAPYRNMEELAANIAKELTPYLNEPYVLFGHSMGGAVLYEVMRILKEEQLPEPVHIMVSCVPMLDAYDRAIVDYRMPEERLVGFYPQLRLENLNNDQALQRRLIDAIRNDMRVLTEYQYKPQKAWKAGISAVCAQDDNLMTCDQVHKWKAMTINGFELVRRPGGHRYLTEDAFFLTGFIMEIVNNHKSLYTK